MKYVQHEHVVARSVAGENLLIPVRRCTNRVYTVNGVGRGLWELLAAPRAETELAEALADRFNIPLQTASTDVAKFLAKMTRMGLVKTQHEPDDQR
jgi:hypothetical protein